MFSSTATYAVRALAHLACRPRGEAVLGRDLAMIAHVPANYLSKILLTLKKAGIVEATRGLGGGYRLHQAPEDVTLAQIFDLFDPMSELPECLMGRPSCTPEDPCPAHERWCRVKETYFHFLSHTSLADISAAAVTRRQ